MVDHSIAYPPRICKRVGGSPLFNQIGLFRPDFPVQVQANVGKAKQKAIPKYDLWFCQRLTKRRKNKVKLTKRRFSYRRPLIDNPGFVT